MQIVAPDESPTLLSLACIIAIIIVFVVFVSAVFDWSFGTTSCSPRHERCLFVKSIFRFPFDLLVERAKEV